MTNLAEILNNAPQGLKLYSLVHGEVTLKKVIDSNDINYPIVVLNSDADDETFTKYGKFLNNYHNAECVLFPSKEHKTWDNWQKVLFQIGDIVTNEQTIKPETFIYLGYDEEINEYFGPNNKGNNICLTLHYYRYATPEEREQFFKELNDNGYTWNADTKQMEKIEQQYTPKYKIGDWVTGKYIGTIQIIGITNNYYNFSDNSMSDIYSFDNSKECCIASELDLINIGIKEKTFTIDDLKQTQFVLARDWNDQEWCLDIYSRKNANDNYVCIHATWAKCIPYNDETKHLLGTTDDCPDKYKTW